MRYFVTIANKTYEVELRDQHVWLNGEKINAELHHVSGTLLRRLSLNGESHRIVATSGEARGRWELHVDGEPLHVDVVDERTRTIRAMTARNAGPQGPKPVRAPMPGMVVRVEVEAGDHVKPGQGVVIIEAMKMENELKSDGGGVVSKVLVGAGTAVEKGAVLVEFAADK